VSPFLEEEVIKLKSGDYNHSLIETKWQKIWENIKSFKVSIDYKKPKFYVLDMFPYPSAEGLHVGHPEGYTATDVVARFRRMRGYNVLHPMGWDAFGLPTERHAVRTGQHPAIITKKNCDTFRRQIKRLGFSYDWDREINTSDPKYYKWTQWIFLQLFEKGLAYRKSEPVNWCPALGTVLANEEVQDGKYVETGDPVEKRWMVQWMLKITEYAERLLKDLDELDWPEGLKQMQREWIGRSEGADIVFKIAEIDREFKVFTTRPDTLFGATYCVLAPEHPLVGEITKSAQEGEVKEYIAATASKNDKERMFSSRSKTGVFTGNYAINPVNGVRIPIWVADYVLISYGYGAIMGVPAHDQRDYDFAKETNLQIIPVISGGDVSKEAFTEIDSGTMINSQFLDGLSVEAAKKKIIDWLEKKGLGKAAVTYKLHDWLFSRQRYWGEPFPIIYLDKAPEKPIADKKLPILLPELDDYRPTPKGDSPLAKALDWINTTDESGNLAKRETDTMPQWAGSCWYFLRYIDPTNEAELLSMEAEKYWMPVDLYIGGAEHAVLHLLYSRFWHKVLYDLGLVSSKEPFKKLFNQGMILARSYKSAQGKYYRPDHVEDRSGNYFVRGTDIGLSTEIEKMSKSKLNVISPEEVIDTYGADSMRLYELFMGPLDRDKIWTKEGITGVNRFVKRVWSLIIGHDGELSPRISDDQVGISIERTLHRTIKAVTEDIENLSFNTAIARMMEFVNIAYKTDRVSKYIIERFCLILSPFTPHLCEELWERLGQSDTLSYESWPEWNEDFCITETITYAIQVNGRLRSTIEIYLDTPKDQVLKIARSQKKIKKYLEGKQIVREIHIPGKIVNLVTEPN